MSDLIFTEQASGATPSVGKRTLFYKTDGKFYSRNSAGVEVVFPLAADITAGSVPNTPAGSIAATTVQGAMNELDAKKVSIGIVLADGVNLDTVIRSGFYRFQAVVVNGPAGLTYSQLIVSSVSDTITQIVIAYTGSRMFVRAGNPSDVGGSGSWSAWQEQANTTSAQTLLNKTISGTDNSITNVRGLAVLNTPAGSIASTNVQSALNELDAKKVARTVYLEPGTDLNTVVTSGFYRMLNVAVNGPPNAGDSQLVVIRGLDTITQIVPIYGTGVVYVRGGSPPDVGGVDVWSAWKEQINANSSQELVNKTLNGSTIGLTNPLAGAFTTLSATGSLIGGKTTGALGVAGNGVPTLEVQSAGGASDAAFMMLHRPASYAVRFGLDTDNQLKIGGFSLGSVAYKIFHQGSVLGPVSQAAGMPTGAVIERGSNANGEFVRFADGTQICTGTFPTLALAANERGSPVAQLFAAAFTGNIAAIAFNSAATVSTDHFGCIAEGSASLTQLTPVFRNGVTAQSFAFIRYCAVGRWF